MLELHGVGPNQFRNQSSKNGINQEGQEDAE